METAEDPVDRYWDMRMRRGILKIRILMRICRGDSYPYAIFQSLKKSKHPVDAGTTKSEVYNILNSLEKLGFVKSKQTISGARLQKTYSATRKGRNSLRMFKKKFVGFMTEMKSLMQNEFGY